MSFGKSLLTICLLDMSFEKSLLMINNMSFEKSLLECL